MSRELAFNCVISSIINTCLVLLIRIETFDVTGAKLLARKTNTPIDDHLGQAKARDFWPGLTTVGSLLGQDLGTVGGTARPE